MTDPHYDAQFRRGYDGPPVAPPATAAPTAAAPAAPARSAEPPAAPREHPTMIDASADVNPRPVDVVIDQEPEPLRRRNPWSITLLVLGLVMLVVGGWLLRAYATTTAINGYSADEQQQVFVQQAVSPALLICGFIAVIAWLVVGALAVRPRS